MEEKNKNVELKEEKIKLLELEKRMVNLELIIENIKEKLKESKIEDVKDILQRFERIENLVMIENAGVIELKKFLESSYSKKDIDELIKKVKEEIAVPQPILDEIKNLKNEVILSKGSIDSLTKNMEKIKSEIDSLKGIPLDIEQIRKEALLQKANLDAVTQNVENMNSDILTLKSDMARIPSIVSLQDEMEKKLTDINLLLQKSEYIKNYAGRMPQLEKKILDNEIVTKKLSNELETVKKNLLSVPHIEYIQKLSNKIETIEKVVPEITNLKTELENNKNKLNSFVSKQDIQQLLSKVKDLTTEVQKNKKDILSIPTRQDIENVREKIEKITNEINSINREVSALKEKVLSTPLVFQDLVNRTIYLEAKMSKLEQFISKMPKAPIIIE